MYRSEQDFRWTQVVIQMTNGTCDKHRVVEGTYVSKITTYTKDPDLLSPYNDYPHISYLIHT